MSGEILKPSGKPFDSVGTEDAIRAAANLARLTGLTVQAQPAVDVLLSMTAHRDHLHHQVTEAQTTATAERDKRMWAVARLRGAMSRVLNRTTGKANPYSPDTDQSMWLAWEEGYDEAEGLHTRSMEVTVYKSRYEGAVAATQGRSMRCPYPTGCVAAENWLHGYSQAFDAMRPPREVGA